MPWITQRFRQDISHAAHITNFRYKGNSHKYIEELWHHFRVLDRCHTGSEHLLIEPSLPIQANADSSNHYVYTLNVLRNGRNIFHFSCCFCFSFQTLVEKGNNYLENCLIHESDVIQRWFKVGPGQSNDSTVDNGKDVLLDVGQSKVMNVPGECMGQDSFWN